MSSHPLGSVGSTMGELNREIDDAMDFFSEPDRTQRKTLALESAVGTINLGVRVQGIEEGERLG